MPPLQFRALGLTGSTSFSLMRSTLSTSFRRPGVHTTCPFSLSSQSHKEPSTDSSVKTDQYPDDEHTTSKTKKGDTLDEQSANAKASMDANKSGTGGSATSGKDSAGGMKKAKEEFPEAPDVAIGMQDERGGRGGR